MTPLLKALLIVLVILAGVTTFFVLQQIPVHTQVVVPQEGQSVSDCRHSWECTLVESACGCSSNGTRVPVNKKFRNYYSNIQQQEARQYACAAAISRDPSCAWSARATCERGRCILKK